MREKAFDIDTSRWPIVVMTLRGELSTEDYEELFDACERVYSRREPCVGVVDSRKMTVAANAAQRKLIVTRTRELEQKYGDVTLGNVMIVNSAFMRGALTAVEWLRARKKRDLWVGSMQDALYEAERICQKNGVSVAKVS